MNVMPIRVFLRGGYRTLTQPTVISRHGRPLFTVYPPYPGAAAMAQFNKIINPITSDRLAAGPDGDRDALPQEVPAQGSRE